jgi:hypothetical protein
LQNFYSAVDTSVAEGEAGGALAVKSSKPSKGLLLRWKVKAAHRDLLVDRLKKATVATILHQVPLEGDRIGIWKLPRFAHDREEASTSASTLSGNRWRKRLQSRRAFIGRSGNVYLPAQCGAGIKSVGFDAHAAQEALHGGAALLDDVLCLVEVEKADAVEMDLDGGVGRVAREP